MKQLLCIQDRSRQLPTLNGVSPLLLSSSFRRENWGLGTHRTIIPQQSEDVELGLFDIGADKN